MLSCEKTVVTWGVNIGAAGKRGDGEQKTEPGPWKLYVLGWDQVLKSLPPPAPCKESRNSILTLKDID